MIQIISIAIPFVTGHLEIGILDLLCLEKTPLYDKANLAFPYLIKFYIF